MGVHPAQDRAPGRAARTGIRALACAAAWAMTTTAAFAGPDAAKSTEDRAIGAFLSYCLPALSGGHDLAKMAEKRKLRPVPPAEQAAYLPENPGTVYELPDVGLGVVLTAADTPACSVMLEKVDARVFLEQATYWLGTDQSPFRLVVNRTLVNGDIQREYRADIDGRTVVLRLNLKLRPVPGAAQAMLAGGRGGAQ